MSNARFEKILRAWHYTDYAEFTQDEITANKASDPFWAVAEFKKDLNEARSIPRYRRAVSMERLP